VNNITGTFVPVSLFIGDSNRQPIHRDGNLKKAKGLKAPKGSRVIEIEWLHNQVLVLFNDKQRYNLARQIGMEPCDPFLSNSSGTASTLIHNDMAYFVMFLPNDEARIAVHECVHIVHMLFHEHGIPLDMPNTEAVAYMTDFLCEEVFQMFVEKGKKK
jgi:hypothetical protein